MASHKIMSLQLNMIKLPEKREHVTWTLGQSYAPNKTFNFSALYEQGYEMSMVRVFHDPGYYIFALQFMFKHP